MRYIITLTLAICLFMSLGIEKAHAQRLTKAEKQALKEKQKKEAEALEAEFEALKEEREAAKEETEAVVAAQKEEEKAREEAQKELAKIEAEKQKMLVAELKGYQKNPSGLNRIKLKKSASERAVDSLKKELRVYSLRQEQQQGEIDKVTKRYTSELNQLETDKSDKERQIASLKSDLAEKQKVLAKIEAKDPKKLAARNSDKLKYRIQIGGEGPLDKLKADEGKGKKAMEVGYTASGSPAFLLGYFDSKKDADQFKQFLGGLTNWWGIWVVGYKDGKRVKVSQP